MCAGYGLGGGRGPLPLDLEPMSEQGNRVLLEEWVQQWRGKANTTRRQKRGVNLNPIILGEGGGERSLELAWWWLHVGGAPAKFSAFNSRDDALVAKWSKPFQHRALIPAEWYSEGGKQWALPDGQLFGIAAIVAPRTTDDGEEGLSYSMVTRHGIGEASAVISSRGESRMPLVLPRELHDEWLDPDRPGDAELVARVQAASEEISRAMGIVAPPAEPEEEAADQTLF